ncbi:MAG TPA: BadF/BadG/BcrA/BcrD ATPase family protein [Mycobacteriales bacterium]|nr:BadF/BadG/BcrA/BcrD ATPase family protein [Mycobacteriales bacterium]
MSAGLVVGVDAGGTATRCLVASIGGVVLARGVAAGASQRSSAGRPAAALAAALRAALSDVDGRRVVAGVVGAAGAGSAGRATARAAAAEAWHAVGLPGEVSTVTDLEVAFAAGTPAAHGLLLLAGTGAVAAALRDGAIAHRCDGYGWLLGDEGGAVWIGRRGLRAVLAGLDGRAAPTALTGPVTAWLLGDQPAPGDPAEHAQALIAAAYAMPPAELGRLAPLVGAAAGAGDPAARNIAGAAAERLLAALATVSQVEPRPAGPVPVVPGPVLAAPVLPGPVVLAGSVLLSPGPVGEAVRAGVRDMFDVEPTPAADGAAGAAALAIARWQGRPVSAAVHARLTSG